jgi:CheY-like chemotaxis protein/signal transduction histidine kinase/CHASE3 domain sensor protein
VSTPADILGPVQNQRSAWLRSSLPPKTLAGFIAATLAVLLIAYLSWQSLESRTLSANRVSQTLETMQILESILSTIKDAETGQRGYLLTGVDTYLEPYTAATLALPREIEQVRKATGETPSQMRRLGGLELLVAEKMTELERTVSLTKDGHLDKAMVVVRGGEGKDLMDRIRKAVEEMRAAERMQLELRNQEWQQDGAFSTTVTWAGSALLLFLIVAAAVLSSNDFREQKVQAWLRSGQTELANKVQGEQDLDELGDNIVAALAKYLGAQVGAVYFTERGERLRRVGSYALPAEGPNSVVPAAGLTQQAFKENSVLSVVDVPDDFFPVNSGLGASKPRHLVVAPASVDGVVNSVIELGFFHPVTRHDLELLRLLAEPVGIALRSSKYRRDLVNLLEETQRQAEELQTQQEELRVNNEELEQQTRAVQQSHERLQNQQAELEQINLQLEEQTQTLERQKAGLTRAQTELQRANTYKSEFLANMSHELRTPLNSSLILAKLLLDNREGNLNAEQVKFAQTIYSAGNDLLALINDILDLSKIEAGKLDVRPENVTLPRVLDELHNAFEPVAKEKKLELVVKLEEGTPGTVHTDSTRMQQILKNLLSNALKFTERGGVSLLVRRAGEGKVAFEVKDTGIGIPAEQHEVIFEAFRQADGTTNRKYGGTGLGLSISRDLARLLGGELTVDSAPGRGSTFTLILPDQYVARDGARSGGAAPLVPPPRRPSLTEHAGRPSPVPQAPIAASTSPITDDRERIAPGARTILIIEDDVEFARIVADLAHELDFQALVAHSAEEGLAMAERYKPSAIVLDVGLPDRSGLSVLDALKHSPATRHIPVHMASVDDYAQTALAMGAAGYAIKPVQREQLFDALKKLEAKFTQKLRRVLVVEDDDIHRDSTCRLLAGDDVETVAVGTATEALEKLRTATFDCMVLDLTLPDRSGFELLEEMSQQEQYSFPPVIVYTGRSLSREEEQRLRRFSNSIIVKGVRSPERLLDEVTLFLHQVESELPADRQRMLRDVRHREAVFEGRRVLVVEDDVRNIFALSSVLEPKGAKVEIARNGREALAHLKEKPGVDLVLMDIMMPEMDGLQATREIRKQPEYAKIPIIALTAKAMVDDRENCLAAGANDYIAKPLDVDKLLSLARVWMPK